MTNLELSKQIGLSPAPTLERVRKLEKNGFVKGYFAELDEKKLDIGIQAIIQVSLTRQVDNSLQKFIDHVAEIDEIVECILITGSFDYQLRVMARDIEGLNKILTEKLGKIEEVRHMQSSIILSWVKDSKVLPIDYYE